MSRILREYKRITCRGYDQSTRRRCTREVICYGFTNTCECGADYNHAGQMLAPRSQWGEETGETAADILGPQNADLDY